MSWTDTLGKLAPTLATALVGPLGGTVLSALGGVLGIDDATQSQISQAIEGGQMTPEHVAKIKELELQYQENEKERGFKYEELAFKDRDSARTNNASSGIQQHIFWLSLLLLTITLGSEVWVLFKGYPSNISDIVVGRVLGLMDSVALLVLSYWYGSTNSSAKKTELIANSTPNK